MSDNLKHLRKLLNDAVQEGLLLTAEYDDEIDYEGHDAAKCLDALTACDEMQLTLRYPGGRTFAGWALIIPSLEPDEVIVDTSGEWMNKWWEANLGSAA